MTLKERRALDALPEKVRIYREYSSFNREVSSWTLDRGVTERFARRWGGPETESLILSATVERDFIVALKLDGYESEVVLFILPGDVVCKRLLTLAAQLSTGTANPVKTA